MMSTWRPRARRGSSDIVEKKPVPFYWEKETEDNKNIRLSVVDTFILDPVKKMYRLVKPSPLISSSYAGHTRAIQSFINGKRIDFLELLIVLLSP